MLTSLGSALDNSLSVLQLTATVIAAVGVIGTALLIVAALFVLGSYVQAFRAVRANALWQARYYGPSPDDDGNDGDHDLPTHDGEPRTVVDGTHYMLVLPLHTGSGSPVEIAMAVREVSHV